MSEIQFMEKPDWVSWEDICSNYGQMGRWLSFPGLVY